MIMFVTNLIRWIAFAALMLAPLPGVLQAAQEAAGPASSSVTEIEVSFKLDPRTTQGVYMGERWVSPPTYSGVQSGKTFTVEAKAEGVDARGKVTDISPMWIPEDPDMVGISPTQGHQVVITVRRTGQTSLNVASQGFSKRLSIKATYQDDAIRVEISQ